MILNPTIPLKLKQNAFGILLPILLIFTLGTTGAADDRNPPDPAYWQQLVNTRIEVRLDPPGDNLIGHLEIDYTNNSPDTLVSLYFHLFQNAFRAGSHMSDRHAAYGDKRLQKIPPEEEGGTLIDHVTDGDGYPLGVQVDDTIMKVTLVSPLTPGENVHVMMDFTTHYGKVTGRMGKQGKQYQVTQWYPRIAVYDRKRGWNFDQHVGFEFYGEWGSFDVAITAPGDYIIAATGLLQNPDEVMPAGRRRALDLDWYAPTVDPESRPEIPDPPDSVLTWRYHADSVHDFAWVADPTFLIGEAAWDGIPVYAYVRKENAAGWQDADSITAEFLRVFSEKIGRYVWPQHTVVDASSGMEYPMLSLDGDSSPEYYGLIGHELAHNWFMGAVGSNETHRAFMDEGFTNFITAWAMDIIFGPESSGTFYKKDGWYAQKFYPRASRRYLRNARRYINFAHSGYLDDLAMDSSWYPEYRNYRQTYFKSSTMLEMLRLVLGDAVFEKALRAYFERWKFRHPYPEDMIAVFEDASGRPLDWFFDQWLYTSMTMDYAITAVDGEWITTGAGARQYHVKIDLERKGDMFMPLDLDFFLRDGARYSAHIPVDDYAKRAPGCKVLPPWTGCGAVRRTYIAELSLPAEPLFVSIDGGGRLPDIDGRDNVWCSDRFYRLQPFGPTQLKFDNMRLHHESLDAYDLLWRPSAGYTNQDGVWLGMHLRGSYLDESWTRFDQLHLYPRIGLNSGRPGYELTYDTPVQWLGRLSRWYLKSAVVDGRSWQEIGVQKTYRKLLTEGSSTKIELAFRSRQMLESNDLAPGLAWNDEINNSLTASVVYQPAHSLLTRSGFFLESTLGGATPPVTRWEVKADGDGAIAGITFSLKFFAGYVTSPDLRAGNQAAARARMAPWRYSPARGATMDLYETYLYRADGGLPGDWWRHGNIVYNDGPAMRGFGDIGPVANRIWTAALDVALGRPLDTLFDLIPSADVRRWLRMPVFAYGEAGKVAWRWDDRFSFPSGFLKSAGFFLQWEPRVPMPGLSRGHVQFYAPLWVDDPTGWTSNDDGIKWRWAIALGT
ncbi:MAG: M1 family metallopeptidase [Candidatus Eisenbacteria bacterium]|nr:M1 family metallopeptidase [Candidatus Eisenbacteria bacterium]MBU1950370.1 M1 family metallopeptidase [Candidatus Eisenbacteria bacterium]